MQLLCCEHSPSPRLFRSLGCITFLEVDSKPELLPCFPFHLQAPPARASLSGPPREGEQPLPFRGLLGWARLWADASVTTIPGCQRLRGVLAHGCSVLKLGSSWENGDKPATRAKAFHALAHLPGEQPEPYGNTETLTQRLPRALPPLSAAPHIVRRPVRLSQLMNQHGCEIINTNPCFIRLSSVPPQVLVLLHEPTQDPGHAQSLGASRRGPPLWLSFSLRPPTVLRSPGWVACRTSSNPHTNPRGRG